MYKIILCLLCLFLTRLAEAGEVLLVDEPSLTREIQSKGSNNNKVLIFFTSWCPHCKNAVMQLAQEFPNDPRIFFISLDKDFNKIFQSKKNYPDHLQIYFLTSTDEIREVFNKFNIKYKNSVPHIAILDGDNRLIRDNATISNINRYLN
jgi:thiol-disulfide isomerase/thioredoxin